MGANIQGAYDMTSEEKQKQEFNSFRNTAGISPTENNYRYYFSKCYFAFSNGTGNGFGEIWSMYQGMCYNKTNSRTGSCRTDTLGGLYMSELL